MSFCVAYFSSTLENKDSIRKEIKTERQDNMLDLNTLLLQIKVVSYVTGFSKAAVQVLRGTQKLNSVNVRRPPFETL